MYHVAVDIEATFAIRTAMEGEPRMSPKLANLSHAPSRCCHKDAACCWSEYFINATSTRSPAEAIAYTLPP